MKQILIADSGGSKTDWRVIKSDGTIAQAKTGGLNPYYHTQESLKNEIETKLLPQILGFEIDEIYFYGAGCSNLTMQNEIKAALIPSFSSANIFVEHDLLAAARALCGHKAGIACILGTGSNSCVFDGKEITENRPSLGLYLGDEGSGGFLGKKIITDWLYGDMPKDLADKFQTRYSLSKEQIFENVYRKGETNRYLASFAHFLLHNISDAYCYRTVWNAFDLFFQNHILRYEQHKNLPTHFTGGIAFHFSNILQRVCAHHSINLGIIAEKPISGLVLFHKEN